MTVSISYQANFGASSVTDYLNGWSTRFGSPEHGKSNPGEFNQPGRAMSGEQYAAKSGIGEAFIAQSDASGGLNYVFDFSLPATSNTNHYLWGTLDTVSLGNTLQGGSGTDFYLAKPQVSFDNLDLSAAQGAGRADNEVQEVIYGLMKGNTAGLESELNDLLDDFGLSTASTFDELAAAGLANVAPAALVDVALVGVQDFMPEMALAA